MLEKCYGIAGGDAIVETKFGSTTNRGVTTRAYANPESLMMVKAAAEAGAKAHDLESRLGTCKLGASCDDIYL